MINKQKSYGERYNAVKVKARFNSGKFIITLIVLLAIAECVLGVLWARGM